MKEYVATIKPIEVPRGYLTSVETIDEAPSRTAYSPDITIFPGIETSILLFMNYSCPLSQTALYNRLNPR